MSEDAALFDPPAQLRLSPGDRVVTRTMWGWEPGTLVHISHDPVTGFPLATIDLDNTDRITVNVARVSPISTIENDRFQEVNGRYWPRGRCGNRTEHLPHFHHSSTLGPFWCHADA